MLYSPVNTIWVLVGAALVFFMQAGFSLCEAGFTRAKNTGNILMKNLMDFCIGTPAFWLVGFGIMFGAGNGLGCCNFPDRVLCNICDHCFRSHGRENKIQCILYLLCCHFIVDLSCFRTLDLGWGMAIRAWIP